MAKSKKEQINDMKKAMVDIKNDTGKESNKPEPNNKKQDDKVKDFVIPRLTPEVNENQVDIKGYKVMTIYPTKLCYFLPHTQHKYGGYYSSVTIIQSVGLLNLLKYSDGKELIEKFLKAVFDLGDKEIEFFEYLDTKNIKEIIDIANNINGISEEDFLMEKIAQEVETEEQK